MEEAIQFLNLKFKGLNKSALLNTNGHIKIVVTVNAQIAVIANEEEKLRNIINSYSYATFDGTPPLIAARLLNPTTKIEKVNGSDFIYDICEQAARNQERVYLLGGWKKSNAESVEIMKKKYGVEIDGHSPDFALYPFERKFDDEILRKIHEFKPHYLLVGFGAPKQEYWIFDHHQYLDTIGVKMAVGVGGTFELVSGMAKRAPKWMQKAGLEWLFRFMQEPRRLFYRYTVVHSKFVYLVMLDVFKKAYRLTHSSEEEKEKEKQK